MDQIAKDEVERLLFPDERRLTGVQHLLFP